MPAGITHLRFGQNKPKPGRKNQATGNTYRPCPSIRGPIENWILVHSGLRHARGKLNRPCTSGLRLTMGQRSNPLAWEWFRRVQVCTQARMVSRA